MKQCVLNSLGVTVPQLALGTVELGLPYGFGLDGKTSQPTFDQARRLVHAALDSGIRFIDTARAYGASEEILGRCLEGRRANLVLATKVGPLQLESRSADDIASDLTHSLEQSLRALRVDAVDWLMIHSLTLEQLAQLPRFLEPLLKLQQQGKFRALGASVYFDTLQPAMDTPEFACIQLAANALDRRPETLLDQSAAAGKDFIVRSILLRGALTERYHAVPASMLPLHTQIAHLDHLARQAGLTLTELAYRYATGADGLLLVGTAEVEELHQAITFIERGPLDADLVAAIRSLPMLDDRYLNPARWPAPELNTSSASA